MEYGFNKDLYPTQRQLINDACTMIHNGQVGIISSPTGTGKTLSLLCTAISFIKPATDDDLYTLLNSRTKTTVYYCSRTHSQLNQVINELRKNKNRYNTVILGSRKQYCLNEKINGIKDINLLNKKCKELLREDSCPYYNEQAYWTRETMDIEDLRVSGKENKFCPYYYTRGKASDCELVLLPYNLLFTREGRESLDIRLDGKILIVDEAHNIYNTIIQLNTAEIYWADIQRISKSRGLTPDLEIVAKRLLEFSSDIKTDGVLNVIDFLYKTKLSEFNMFEIEELIVDKKLGQRNDLDAFFEFAKFLKLLTYSDNDGRVFYSTNKIRFTPLNPKMYFEEVKKCKSVIFAGGTMEPISQLKAIFPEIKYKCYPPISSNFFSLIISETVTKKPINLDYKNRVEILDDVLNTLVTLTNPIRTGGIIIFLPSKQFLEMIQQSEVVKSFRRKLYFETDKVFDSFKKDPQILLAVMGGRLSEGINFSDDLCRLVIVVGVPFPTNNLEFEERCKYNKDYAVQSAMNVVNQSIGRALRHKDDYAAIVLLDMRYCSLKTHLSQWIGAKTCISKPIEALIKINQFLTRNSLKKTTS